MADETEPQVPEIGETEEDKKFTIKEMKKHYFSWALENLRGKNILNKMINKNISISRDGLGEWKTKTKSREQIISIKILDQLLEHAVFWKEELPKNPDPNIDKVFYFRQDCKVNRNMFTAIITVKVYKTQNLYKYYHHYLDDFVLYPKS